MPPPVSENGIVAAHYATQVSLVAAFLAQVRALRPRLTAPVPTEAYLTLIGALVSRYAAAGVSTSLDYYTDMRLQGGVRSPYRPPVVEAPTPAVVQAAILAALGTSAAPSPAADVVPDELTADAIASLIEGITGKLVIEAGRDQVWTAIENDVAARGWARVTRPGACAFCRLLATRGAVYRTERSASFAAHSPGPNGGGLCQCGVEPLFAQRYEPPAHTRADQQLYSEVSEGRGVATGDRLYNFRRAVEGRTDGPRRAR